MAKLSFPKHGVIASSVLNGTQQIRIEFMPSIDLDSKFAIHSYGIYKSQQFGGNLAATLRQALAIQGKSSGVKVVSPCNVYLDKHP